MLKTRDNHEVQVGDWLSDQTGIYEVQAIDLGMGHVTLKELMLEDDGTYSYVPGCYRMLTPGEIRHMDFV